MQNDIMESAVKTFRSLAAGCDRQGLEKANQVLTGIKGILDDVQIPILSNDLEVRKYVEMFELQKPENMIRFFVEGGFATIECIHDSIESLKMQNLDIVLGGIQGTKNLIILGLENPEWMEEKLSDAQTQLFRAMEQLQNLLKDIYIREIYKIDNRSKWEFFLKAKFSLSAIDTNNECAKRAVKALDMAVRMQMLIAGRLHMNIHNSVIIPYLQFCDQTLTAEVCNLMHEYDKEKETEYWKRIPEGIKKLQEAIDEFEKYMEYGVAIQTKENTESEGIIRRILRWLTMVGIKRKNKETQA